MRDALPRGGTLREEAFQKRHRAILTLLWLHALLLPVFALTQGFSATHALAEGLLLASFALGAHFLRRCRRRASTLVSLGLITSSAFLVHLSGGVIEAHFHFFVMITVLALYEDWLPFLVAAAYVTVHHGLIGVVAADTVYNHPDAIAHPLKWALIHGTFVAAAGAASVVGWRFDESARGAAVGAERDAAEARALLVALVDSSGDAIIGSARDGTIISWNQGAEDLLGYTCNEALGKSLALLEMPDRREEEAAIRAQTERAEHRETVWVTRDGRQLVVALTISPIASTGDGLSGVSTIARDITQRIQTERYLDVQHQAVVLMAQSPPIGEALHSLLRVIGRGMGWPVADCWMVTDEGPPATLGCVAFWEEEGHDAKRFAASCRGLALAPGIGMPGRVWESRQAIWISDVTQELDYRRKEPAAADGLHACFLLPVTDRTGTRAVLEFFSYEMRQPEPRLLEMLNTLAGSIGQFLERKRAEEALATSERATRQILETAHDAFIAMDSNGAITDWNPQAEMTFGWRRQEVLGRELAEVIVPESLREAHRSGMERFLATGECPVLGQLLQLPALRRDGAEVAIEITISALSTDDGYSFNAFVRDITDRKAAAELVERQRRQLMDAQSIGRFGSWESDIAVEVMEWSDGLFRIYGLEHSEEPQTFDSFSERVHPDDRHAVRAAIASARDTGEAFSFEHRIVCPDGTVRVHHARGEVVVGDDGAPLKIRGTSQDITERSENELAKDEFTSIVSHELRTPLTSIRGALGLLAGGVMGPVPEKGKRMLDIAISNTDRLVRLINDILDVERIAKGEIQMDFEKLDGAELLVQVSDAMGPIAQQAGVSIVVRSAPAQLWGDRDRIIQTLTNLLSNAIKFSEPGAKVWLSCEESGRDVLMVVRDEGRGIPSDKLDIIFERFQQVDATDVREKSGTGLGLAICRSIVQEHGGTISVESEPGRGSTFSFTIPCPVDDAVTAGPHGRAGKLVLLIDDDPVMLETAGTVLERAGYETLRAPDGTRGVALARERRPDLIVLDLLMPGDSDIAGELQRDTITVAIPVVQQPLDTASLLEAVERALGERDDGAHDVVVAEDDEGLALVLLAILGRHGYRAFHAGTGREAVELTRRLEPRLLVLDIGLPDGDGFEVVKQLRRDERHANMPLAVYTARDIDQAQREQLKLGPTTFLTKSRVAPEEFERRVLELLAATVTDTPHPSAAPR